MKSSRSLDNQEDTGNIIHQEGGAIWSNLEFARKNRCEDIRVLILILRLSLIRSSPDSPGQQSMD